MSLTGSGTVLADLIEAKIAAAMGADYDAANIPPHARRARLALAEAIVEHIVTMGVVVVVTACPAGSGTGTGTIT